MTTTIQIEEESAIIPLRRLNEMKANEEVFRSDSKFIRLERNRDDWDNKTNTYFIANEWEATSIFNDKLREKDREIELLKSKDRKRDDKLNELVRIIENLEKKKWYQFVAYIVQKK